MYCCTYSHLLCGLLFTLSLIPGELSTLIVDNYDFCNCVIYWNYYNYLNHVYIPYIRIPEKDGMVMLIPAVFTLVTFRTHDKIVVDALISWIDFTACSVLWFIGMQYSYLFQMSTISEQHVFTKFIIGSPINQGFWVVVSIRPFNLSLYFIQALSWFWVLCQCTLSSQHHGILTVIHHPMPDYRVMTLPSRYQPHILAQ